MDIDEINKILEDEEDEPIDCKKRCVNYSRCYPFVNLVACSNFMPSMTSSSSTQIVNLFRVGYKAGYGSGYKQRRLEENPLVQQCMRKVVEWIEKNSALDSDDETSQLNGYRSFDDADWQKFLKDILEAKG